MNFDGFNFDSDTRRTLSLLVSANRLPHAVIIESRSAQKALEVATYLSAFAVCGSGEKPCGACKQCKNAFARAHCDIQYVKPDSKSKTGIYNIDQIRALAGDAQIRPNDADCKVYIFEEADKRFPEREGAARHHPIALHRDPRGRRRAPLGGRA